MARLFHGTESRTAPGGLAYENISTSFRAFQRSPLQEQEEPAYSTHRSRRSFSVAIRKASLFCWSLVPERRYRDLVLVADMAFGDANGHSAMGFVLRYLDDTSFYYFLISNRGEFRFDLALNGNHIPLIEWTRSPLISAGGNHLRVVSRGATFGFYLDEEWIAELEDDRIENGAVGFAAQNFEEEPRARFVLGSLQVESRPREVELAFERWTRVLPADKAARVRLAQTLAGMGGTEAAIVQLNKAARDGGLAPEELCLLARLCLASRLYPPALEAVEKCLAAAPGNVEALVEKAEILYALNRLVECRELATATMRSSGGIPPLAMILGNAEYALGNWRAAAEAYLMAWEREGAPLAAANAARSLSRLGETDRALGLAVAAAEAYYQRGSLAEIDKLIAEIERTHVDRPEVRTLKARVAYWRGEEAEAGALLDALVAEGVKDSAVYYLDGLLLLRRGQPREALRRFERAAELEPEAAVYWFRLAETRHLLGQDASAPLQEALRRAPEDPWSQNLRGLLLTEDGDLEAAEEALTLAAERAPDAPEIIVNLSDVLRRRGRTAEALELLERAIERRVERDGERESAAVLVNQRGNVLAAGGDIESAHAEYERALKLHPDNADYLENCARACIEQDLVMRAEECLGRLLDLRPNPTVYGLVGNVAAIQLQYDRAEAAFRQGLAGEPARVDLLASLAALLVARGSAGAAREAVERLARAAAGQPEAELRATRALAQLHARFDVSLRCGGCSRRWWVPRDLPPQPTLRVRGDPPDDAPVGSCPDCGAIYCAACARENVVDGRFTCPRCSVALKVADARLVYLFRKSVEAASGRAP